MKTQEHNLTYYHPYMSSRPKVVKVSPANLDQHFNNKPTIIHEMHVLISDRIWPIIKYLKLTGFLRVSKHDQPQPHNEQVFYCKILSLESLRVLIVQILLFLFNLEVAEKSFPKSATWVVYVLLLSGIFNSSLSAFLTWFRCGSTTRVQNGWIKIENKFLETFGRPLLLPKLADDIRQLTLFHFKAPLSIYFIVVILQFAVSKFVFKQFVPYSVLLRILIVMIISAGSFGLNLLFYVICHIMSCAYEALHQQMGQSQRIDSKMISEWKAMLIVVGTQLRDICDWISPVKTVHTIIYVMHISTSLYTLLWVLSYSAIKTVNSMGGLNPEIIEALHSDIENFNGTNGNLIDYELTPDIVAPMALTTMFLTMEQLLMAVFYAEKIYKSFGKITSYLSAQDTSQLECGLKIELQSFIDTLRRSPSKLMFYRCVNLDRKLILLVINASITYLIVLLQFKPL